MSTRFLNRCANTGAAFALGLMLSFSVGAELDLPDYPLFLASTGVTPNILVTIDDSGSMSRSYTPDLCGFGGYDCNELNNRWVLSAHGNSIYYNPNVIYKPPKKADGTYYSTSFTQAWRNGFYTEGTVNGVDFSLPVNLALAYRPTAQLAMNESTPEKFIEHFSNTEIRKLVPAGSATIEGTTGPDARFPDDGRYNANVEIASIDSVIVNNVLQVYKGTTDRYCDPRPENNNEYRLYKYSQYFRVCFKDNRTMDNESLNIKYSWNEQWKSFDNNDPVPAYYYKFDDSNNNCSGTDGEKKIDNDCYTLKFVGEQAGPIDIDEDGDVDGDDERQNFANWYSFYRTRYLATASGATLAFAELPPETRLAWQSLNTCRLPDTNCDGWTGTYGSNTIGFFSEKKQNFYNWLGRIKTDNSTPLHAALNRASTYFRGSGENGPYDNDFNAANSGEYACRRNYHILMTDGIWSDSTSRGNVDNTTITLPDDDTQSPPTNESYSPSPPFSDNQSNTLADNAFYHWATDLRTDLDNIISPSIIEPNISADQEYWDPKNNPATWQHISTYTIGLGLSEFITKSGLRWSGDTFLGSYTEISDGEKEWPRAAAQSENNASDLWHAAINSRGKFYSAESSDDIVNAFDEILDTISRADAAGGGAALSTNTAIAASETAIYKASFSGDGSGNLIALPISAQGELGDDGAAYWEAANSIPESAERNILTTNTIEIGNDNGTEFLTCNNDLATALNKDKNGNIDNLCMQRLNFLRSNWLPASGVVTGASWSDGKITFEVDKHGFTTGDSIKVSGVIPNAFNGTYIIRETNMSVTPSTFSVDKATTPGTWSSGGKVAYADFRNRNTTVLGGITHSAPVYVHDENAGYGSMSITGADSYPSYVESKANRSPMLYVGANDGMLHGFYAPNCSSVDDCTNKEAGAERFAYVPRGVYDKLSWLTDPIYTTTFYVDGSPTVNDVYINGRWKTYLVGSLRGGGKSVFALDVSDPDHFLATDVKWEFTDPDLWLTYSQPQISADTPNRWVTIFGNGYKSSSDPASETDSAYLYVVNLANGDLITKLRPSTDTGNGLGTPLLYDSAEPYGVVDSVYVGDLKGRLWKFVNNDGNWSVGNGGNPLFQARDSSGASQPITVKPAIVAHPEGGVLIYFGTGKYLEFDDLTDSQRQTFYAIWDKPSSSIGTTLVRENLEAQSIISTTNTSDYTVRITSNNQPDWNSDRGWYLDLPAPTAGAPAERIISPALVMQFETVPDRVLFVTNVVTSDPCSRGGTSWLMELSLLSGGRTDTSIYDLNGDNQFNDDDLVSGNTVSGIALPQDYGLVGTPLLVNVPNPPPNNPEEPPHNPEEPPPPGLLAKVFTGSTGKSGTPTATQSRDPDPPENLGNGQRLHWRELLEEEVPD